MTMTNVDIVRNAYEAFARGDVPAVLALMSETIEWSEAEGHPYRPSGQPWIGPDAILKNLFVRIGEDWNSFTIHRKRTHDAGNIVVVEARYSGVYKKNGRLLDAQVCHVWEIVGGKLSKFQQYVDTAELQKVMGAQ